MGKTKSGVSLVSISMVSLASLLAGAVLLKRNQPSGATDF
jgi:hypothetical protein